MTDSSAQKHCPKCDASNMVEELPRRDYRCGDCGLELAHLDTLPSGGVRGVLGWLLEIGAVVHDRYRISAVLGKGGFGVTYLVDDDLLHGKRRALKEVPLLLFDEYETRLLGRLNHPAIPDISDRFEAGGMVYQVLEFGGDRTLRIERERRGGRIPLFVLLPWMRQLCEALHYLHGQEPPVVHRDLKPDNVLLDEHDRVMLIDFGIAKEAAPDTATRTIGRAVSQGFSPPEQVFGTGTDARSDIYALGAIQYHCLTGEMPPPAHERITGTTIRPISEFLPEIPPLIETAVMQALELNINLRQQSIGEFASVLELIQAGSGSAATISVAASASPRTASADAQLPSVQIHSLRTTDGSVPHASMRVQVPPGKIAMEADAPTQRRGLMPLLAASSLVLALAASGGWWWWSEHGAPHGSDAQGDMGASSDAGAKPSTVGHAGQAGAAGVPAEHGSTKVATSDASSDAPTAEAPATEPLAKTPVEPGEDPALAGTGISDQTPPGPGAISGGETATNVSAAASASAALVAGAAAAKVPVARRATDSNALPAGPLPSIFSDEQPRSSVSVAPGLGTSKAGATTLMDLFENHRSTSSSLQSSTPAATSPPVKQSPATKTAKTMPKAQPKPKAKKPTPRPAPKRKVATAPKPRPKPKASSSNDWGFQYKGSRKTD